MDNPTEPQVCQLSSGLPNPPPSIPSAGTIIVQEGGSWREEKRCSWSVYRFVSLQILGLASSGKAPMSYLRWLSNHPWLQGSRESSVPQTSVWWRHRTWYRTGVSRRDSPGTGREWEGVSEAGVLAMQAWLLVDALSLSVFLKSFPAPWGL